MAPLVLIGTLTTHLFGGSAGREGTAVQMGGSLASLLARGFKLRHDQHRLILMCGMAAGFGAVFGTPLTGALFAMEVLVIGRLKYEAFIPLLIASLVGDLTCTAWGIRHTDYTLDTTTHAPFQMSLLAKAALSGVAFGWAARFFSELTHGIQRLIAKWVVYTPLRPAVGGCVVIILVYVLGTRDYLGLGVDVPPSGQVSIAASFHEGGATPWSWLWKTLFTAVTCGTGFKGGEVTPLFFIGSTLGHTLGVLLNEPVALFAAFGFIAVFAGAANTPVSCTVMGMELFGAQSGVYFAVVCFVAFYSSGHSGIYLSQRLARSQCTLREAREMKSKRQTL
jgi:H+/Cl- antiporter ClcA